MKFQNIHAHFDDFEFTVAGTFEMARRLRGSDFSAQVVVCTDGAAGHHFLGREETARVRKEEQEASAAIGRYELNCLCYPDGSRPKEGYMQAGPQLLAALWKAIRDFRPDYLFCPPIPSNRLAGVHVDHLVIAEAVRRVAFLVNVPQAFTEEYPAPAGEAEKLRTPVILNVFDGYMFENRGWDLAVDVTGAFDLMAEMSWCHRSQVMEWLPWVGDDNGRCPRDFGHWKDLLRQRQIRQNRNAGIESDKLYEFLTLTGWGSCPDLDQLLGDIPNVDAEVSPIDLLKEKIRQIRGQ